MPSDLRRQAVELAQLLDEPLTVVDAGCRWGTQDEWLALGSAVRIYGFDPDEEECRRLSASLPLGAPVEYVPLGLGARDGPRTLHITEEPACSSLYPPDEELVESIPELGVIELRETADVHLRTLDGWAADAGVGRIDCMKLDVQGAELDVLRGATQSLRTTRMLEVEVTFNPIYKGQALFGEVDGFLRERGFVLWRLGHLVHYSRVNAAVVAASDRQFFDSRLIEFDSGPGQVFWGHAHYCAADMVRRAEPRSWMQAARDACLAASFGFEDLMELAASPALADTHPDDAARLRRALR